MAEQNTENVNENIKDNSENLKLTLQNMFAEYQNEELLYPNEKLRILKRRLEIVRSSVDSKFKKTLSPVRRPMDNTPLHEVYKNLMNKDSFTTLASILANENDVCSKYTNNDKYYRNS